MLYLAYGSNLNQKQMKQRCPSSFFLQKVILEDWTLTFKGVADIIKVNDSQTPAGLYEITKECEISLDHYEGFPSLYKKEYIEFNFNGSKETALTYIMNDQYDIGPPVEAYYEIIKQGYQDCKLDYKSLIRAVNYSIEFDTGKSFKEHYWLKSPIIKKQRI